MSICIKIKKTDGFETRSILCPVCKIGHIVYKIRPSGQKEFNLACRNCYTIGSPDWFEMITDTQYGKNVRKDFICGNVKQIPIC